VHERVNVHELRLRRPPASTSFFGQSDSVSRGQNTNAGRIACRPPTTFVSDGLMQASTAAHRAGSRAAAQLKARLQEFECKRKACASRLALCLLPS